MTRLIRSAELGWLRIPELGEAGAIEVLEAVGEPFRPGIPNTCPPGWHWDPDNQVCVPPSPPPNPDPPPPHALEPWPGEDVLYGWEAIADAGGLDVLEAREFAAGEYVAARACTIPERHPPPGTVIATAADHARRALGDWQSDNAVDIWLYPGTAVVAIAAGRVSTRYGYGLSGSDPAQKIAGYRLHVEHAGGMLSFYTHMQRLAIARGVAVTRGTLLGYSGFAACVPHLHMAVSRPFRPEAFASRSYRLGARDRRPPPREPPPPPPRRPRRTPEQAWHNLLEAVGPDRHRQRRRVAAAGRALKRAVR